MATHQYIPFDEFIVHGQLNPGDPIFDVFHGWWLYIEKNDNGYIKARRIDGTEIRLLKKVDVMVSVLNYQSIMNYGK